jgi:hypothetical protein
LKKDFGIRLIKKVLMAAGSGLGPLTGPDMEDSVSKDIELKLIDLVGSLLTALFLLIWLSAINATIEGVLILVISLWERLLIMLLICILKDEKLEEIKFLVLEKLILVRNSLVVL